MLSISQETQQTSEISSVILRASSDLANCSREEIEEVVQQSIITLSVIEHAEEGGWFSFMESGKLTDIFPFPRHLPSLRSALRENLNQLPWCFAQLNAGKAVLIDDVDLLSQAAEVDQQLLREARVRSLALFPSSSAALGRTVLILLSGSKDTRWSEQIVEQCTLLENIFSNGLQRGLAEDESRLHLRSYRHLFTVSTTPMAIINSDGQFVSTNNAFRVTLGYLENELRTMKCDDIVKTLNQLDGTSSLKYSSSPTLANQPLERTLIRKDESPMRAQVSVEPFEQPSLKGLFSLVTIIDFTEYENQKKELTRRQTEVGVLASLLIQSHENDRKRLSRELHDDIGQRLSMAASEVAVLASQPSTPATVSTGRLERLREELDSLCTDVHEISHDLHSYKLQHLGLGIALSDLCRRLTQPAFRVDLHAVDLVEPTCKDVSLCLYRVAQESLNNVLKHGHASVAAVSITKLQDTFYMSIQDSGIGFDSNASSPGLGLVSMNERLKLVGGQFKIHSVPGHGTEIWVSVPDRPALTTLTSGFHDHKQLCN
jgi:PAS domain S-box-containing protein